MPDDSTKPSRKRNPRKPGKANGRAKHHPISHPRKGRQRRLLGPHDPVWLLLNETDPKFDGLKAQTLASLVEVVGMAERRLDALIEKFALSQHAAFHIVRGGRHD